MTRWDWSWEDPVNAGPDGDEAVAMSAAGALQRRRRAFAGVLLGTVVVIVALVALGLASGGRPRPRAIAATAPLPPIRARRGRARGDPGARAVDAVLRRDPVVFEGGHHGDEVALTFDDGPGPYTPALVRELRRLGVRATFFAIGEMERYFAAGSRSERRAGEVIGDHTETHPLLARLTPGRQRAEIDAQAATMSALGVPYPRLFRPPYGSYDAATLAALRPLHMLLVLWSIDSQDYTRPGVRAIVRRVLGGVRAGSIILLHDAGGDRRQTIAALPLIVRGLRRRHLLPVTVLQLLHDDPPPPGLPVPRVGRD